ncbi:hypothetical protein RJT34_17436 [Clitoria ternatea]|uniref:Uncharacterized protein n=1 Tax=Clitoria ternatea TaxID=43366 RepID=A0AAN9J9B9_CLITE
MPTDATSKERVKKGNLQSAKTNVHVKPMLRGTFTDIAIWVFYPFNGAVRAKVEFLTLNLGSIGEHVGDWEHVTLRVSNFDGELWQVYFSEHSKGSNSIGIRNDTDKSDMVLDMGLFELVSA